MKKPLWWRILAYLPEGRLYTQCATCLFWRGALVGGIIEAPFVYYAGALT